MVDHREAVHKILSLQGMGQGSFEHADLRRSLTKATLDGLGMGLHDGDNHCDVHKTVCTEHDGGTV